MHGQHDDAVISVKDADSSDSERETVEMDSHDIDSNGDADEQPFLHAFDPYSDDLPPLPTDTSWTPTQSVAEWTTTLFSQLPTPLRLWIAEFEPSMRCSWQTMLAEHRPMLPVLFSFVLQFPASDRREAVRHLFTAKGLLVGHEDMFQHMFCGLPAEFGHVDFKAEDDTSTMRVVMAVADCFISLIDSSGFSPAMHWSPLPEAKDPTNFKAGGVHSKEARAAWDELNDSGPGVSKWVMEWVHNRVWFVKNRPHKVDRSARNAPCFDKSSRKHEPDKCSFMSKKVQEMLRVGAVVKLPRGPDRARCPPTVSSMPHSSME